MDPALQEERTRGVDLLFAAAEGSLEQAKDLLSARVDPNFRDYEKRCPLHVAAGTGKCLDVLQLLIDHKADVNTSDCWGQTPLFQSQRGGHISAEQLLKANGAKLLKTRLQQQSVREKWEVRRSEVKLGAELSRTLKSVVHRATWNGTEVVAKFSVPDSQELTPEELEDEMLHEIALLSTVRHPDLVMFLGCCLQESPIMFITQYMPKGDLESYYASKRAEGRPWAAAKKVVNRWGRSILLALNFLHTCSQPIIHRDLKPLNILLTESLEVKVTDFGISKVTHKKAPQWMSPLRQYPASKNSDASCMTGGVGTWKYMAPEVARHEKYTEKVDIYAFGLILYFMSCGRQPFHEYQDPVQVLEEFSRGMEPRPKASECPAVFRPVMEAAWDGMPQKRPEAGALVEHLVEIHSGSSACTCTSM